MIKMEYKKMKGKKFEHCQGHNYSSIGSLDENKPIWQIVKFLGEGIKTNFKLDGLNVTYEKCKCNNCSKEFDLIQVKNGLETLESMAYDTKSLPHIHPRD